MKALALSSLLLLSACAVSPEAAPQGRLAGQGPQTGQAVEAVFARGAADDWHDVDPVQARAASFGRVIAVVDAFPWRDQLVETLPVQVSGAVTPSASAVTLSNDLVDSDPLRSRGWR